MQQEAENRGVLVDQRTQIPVSAEPISHIRRHRPDPADSLENTLALLLDQRLHARKIILRPRRCDLVKMFDVPQRVFEAIQHVSLQQRQQHFIHLLVLP